MTVKCSYNAPLSLSLSFPNFLVSQVKIVSMFERQSMKTANLKQQLI